MPALLNAWNKLVRADLSARAVIEAASGKIVSRADLAARAAGWRTARTETLDGQRVAFAAPVGAAWFEIFIGLLQAGAVPAPIDATEPAAAQRELARAV